MSSYPECGAPYEGADGITDPTALLDDIMLSFVDWRRLSNDELRQARPCAERTREWLRRNGSAVAAWVDRNHSSFMTRVERITRAHVDDRTLGRLGEELGDLAGEVARRALNYQITDALLHRIARQVVAEKARQRRVACADFSCVLAGGGADGERLQAADSDGGPRPLAARDGEIRTALRSVLTPGLAEVVWLKVYCDYDLGQVAAALGIAMEAVKKRYQRAVQLLHHQAATGRLPSELADPDVARRYATRPLASPGGIKSSAVDF